MTQLIVFAVVGLSAIACSGAPTSSSSYGQTSGDNNSSGAGNASGTSAAGGGGSSTDSTGGGGSGSGASSASAAGSSSASTAAGGDSSSGGSLASDDAGSGGGGDDASTYDPTKDPEIAYSVTLKMDSFTLMPGEETYVCQDFANPFKGQQADIKTYELHMAKGSHHMFAFYKSNATNGSIYKCPQGGLTFAPFTFTAQTQDAIQTYPETVGATIPATTGFMLNVHYINTGTTPLPCSVTLTLHVAKSGVITQHAGIIFLNQALLTVPATGQPQTSVSNFTLPQDVNILFSSSHMHKRATAFSATASTGETLFSTDQWAEPPPKTYTPALKLSKGTNITWSCTYLNDTGQVLTFGESANTNVMCISVSAFYPVQDVNNPVISTQF